jgi:hypothetical protein
MGHASALLGSAALEEVAKLGLRIEAHRHAAFAVRDRNGELIALAFVAAALLDEGAWPTWILSVVPSENLHRSTPWKKGRFMGEEKANVRADLGAKTCQCIGDRAGRRRVRVVCR